MFFLFKIGFLEIKLVDILDIFLLGILIYTVYRLIRGGLAFNILIGLFIIFLINNIVKSLEMRLMSSVMDSIMAVGVIALIIVFQPEIRRFLLFIGRGSGIGKQNLWKRIFSKQIKTSSERTQEVNNIAMAVSAMSSKKIGALMVFLDESEKTQFTEKGVLINGDISAKLLESIFEKTSPLHDGAVIISDSKVVAAGCVLPISDSSDLPSRVGLRHRAAVGVTEVTDAAKVIVVSEETGKISMAEKGRLTMNISEKNLLKCIESGLNMTIQNVVEKKK